MSTGMLGVAKYKGGFYHIYFSALFIKPYMLHVLQHAFRVYQLTRSVIYAQ